MLKSIVLLKWRIWMWPYSFSPWSSHLPNLENTVEFLEATCVFGCGMILAWGSSGCNLACICRGGYVRSETFHPWSSWISCVNHSQRWTKGAEAQTRWRGNCPAGCCETSLILTFGFHGIPGSFWLHSWPGRPSVWSIINPEEPVCKMTICVAFG